MKKRYISFKFVIVIKSIFICFFNFQKRGVPSDSSLQKVSNRHNKNLNIRFVNKK